MKFKKRSKDESETTQWYFKIEDNGISIAQCTEEAPEFKQWIAEGNTPEEAD